MAAPVTAAPNPNDIRRQYQIDTNGAVYGTDDFGITPAQTTVNAKVYGALIPISGAAKVRIRAKHSTAAATLRAAFVLADGKTDSASTDNPANVALSAGVEASMNITTSGEGWLHVSVLAGGAGTLNFVDVSQL